jgi:hypothetical protein
MAEFLQKIQLLESMPGFKDQDFCLLFDGQYYTVQHINTKRGLTMNPNHEKQILLIWPTVNSKKSMYGISKKIPFDTMIDTLFELIQDYK